jgi:threonine dehydratase
VLLERVKLVAEGAGAVAPAAVLRDKIGSAPGPLTAVLSGGNIDRSALRFVIGDW